MDGFVIIVHVELTAEQDGRNPQEGSIIREYVAQIAETQAEAILICKDEDALFDNVCDAYCLPFGVLSSIWVSHFQNNRWTGGWQANYWENKAKEEQGLKPRTASDYWHSVGVEEWPDDDDDVPLDMLLIPPPG